MSVSYALQTMVSLLTTVSAYAGRPLKLVGGSWIASLESGTDTAEG